MGRLAGHCITHAASCCRSFPAEPAPCSPSKYSDTSWSKKSTTSMYIRALLWRIGRTSFSCRICADCRLRDHWATASFLLHSKNRMVRRSCETNQSQSNETRWTSKAHQARKEQSTRLLIENGTRGGGTGRPAQTQSHRSSARTTRARCLFNCGDRGLAESKRRQRTCSAAAFRTKRHHGGNIDSATHPTPA